MAKQAKPNKDWATYARVKRSFKCDTLIDHIIPCDVSSAQGWLHFATLQRIDRVEGVRRARLSDVNLCTGSHIHCSFYQTVDVCRWTRRNGAMCWCWISWLIACRTLNGRRSFLRTIAVWTRVIESIEIRESIPRGIFEFGYFTLSPGGKLKHTWFRDVPII